MRLILLAVAGVLLLAPATTVAQAIPGITTKASPGVTLGNPVSDTALVTGRVNPVGGDSVIFRLYEPGDVTCSGGPVFESGSQPIDGSGAASSGLFTPTISGTYRWRAFYSGDPENAAVSSPCDDSRGSVIVTRPLDTRITKTPTRRFHKQYVFAFKSSEPATKFRCAIDGNSTSCKSPQKYRFSDLSPGQHAFAVTATDRAGNTDLTPDVATFLVVKKKKK